MNDRKSRPPEWQKIQSKLNKLFVHDLKNPISALAANLSFLESVLAEESESVRDAVRDSIISSKLLLRFSENLNLIAMLEVGETMPTSEVSLESFIPAVVYRLQPFAASAAVALKEAGPAPRATISWQHQYGEAALENLILAAIRHSPEGGEVSVEARVDARKASITVCDEGARVEPELVRDLFSRATQSEAMKRPQGRYGRGLGLYAAGLAVKAIDGDLLIVSDENRTEITLTVPSST